MAARQYQYVGPDDIREAALPSSPAGTPIRSADDLLAWIAGRSSDTEPAGSLIATFTVDVGRTLLLAPRRFEHVACAGGDPVRSAGEITFSADGDVSEIINQSAPNRSHGRPLLPHWMQSQSNDRMISQRASSSVCVPRVTSATSLRMAGLFVICVGPNFLKNGTFPWHRVYNMVHWPNNMVFSRGT